MQQQKPYSETPEKMDVKDSLCYNRHRQSDRCERDSQGEVFYVPGWYLGKETHCLYQFTRWYGESGQQGDYWISA